MTQDMTAQKQAKSLPKDKTQALTALINITQALIDMADRESSLLARDDMMALHTAQGEKAFLAARYEKLSTEFRARIEEFRGMDRGILDRLEHLQATLGEKTQGNNDIVSGLCKSAIEKTQSSLFTVQALAQEKPVRLNGAGTQGAHGDNAQSGSMGA